MSNETKDMSIQIRGKVAEILTSREVAINVGEDDGVALGMIFDILHDKGLDIRDPTTGEVLGDVKRSKVRVKVTHVQDRLSVASTYKKKKVNIGGNAPDISGFSKALSPQKWVSKFETLKATEMAWEHLEEEDSYVKIGDAVLQVLPILNDAATEQGESVG